MSAITIKVSCIHMAEVGVNAAGVGDVRFVARSGHEVTIQGIDIAETRELAKYVFDDVELEITVRPFNKPAEPQP